MTQDSSINLSMNADQLWQIALANADSARATTMSMPLDPITTALVASLQTADNPKRSVREPRHMFESDLVEHVDYLV